MRDPLFLGKLLKQTGFDHEDRTLLRGLLPMLEPETGHLADRFYERILGDPEARRTLGGDEARAARLKVTMVRFILSGFAGPHDEAWLEGRARIGRVHVQIDLPQHLMIIAMNGLRRDLRALLEDRLEHEPKRRRRASVALDRLLDLELAIMLHTYREDSLARLARKERLATIGELAASIAHDLRNPLGVIQSSLFLLAGRFDPEDDPAATRHLEKIRRQVERCDQIITDLLALVRGRAPQVAQVSILRLFESVAEQAELPASIALALEVDPELRWSLDEGLIRQALENLIENAKQALDDNSGTLRLVARSTGDTCLIDVEDSGPGFPAELLATAFEPLVTGRPQGVGLGLAIVRGIVERHGGSCEAGPAPSGGARVRLRLPAHPPVREEGVSP